MSSCDRPIFAALTLAIAIAMDPSSPSAFAQARTVGPRADDDPSPRSESRVESAAFDALGREWVEAHLNVSDYEEAVVDPDTARVDWAGARTRFDADAMARERAATGTWVADKPTTSQVLDRTRRFRVSDALATSSSTPGILSVRGAASASQAEARRAIVNALARTPLGRALGKVFLIHRDDPDFGPDAEAPTSWSKVFPLLSPRLNARTRTVGLTFVWRF
jgi:hypothetical protein